MHFTAVVLGFGVRAAIFGQDCCFADITASYKLPRQGVYMSYTRNRWINLTLVSWYYHYYVRSLTHCVCELSGVEIRSCSSLNMISSRPDVISTKSVTNRSTSSHGSICSVLLLLLILILILHCIYKKIQKKFLHRPVSVA